ncbi:MAG: hypothetical protein QXF26_00180 [Candidatus Bathyarchaeia archaeon]
MTSVRDVWYPVVFPERCDGCKGIEIPHCIQFCPKKVFEVRGEKVEVAHPLECIYGCNACELVCPRGAISFPSSRKQFQQPTESWSKSLHKVSCRLCGKTFWTNFETDVCSDCNKKIESQH